jgi:molybdate transport system substrate-binding protein
MLNPAMRPDHPPTPAPPTPSSTTAELVVSAAASLQDVLQAIAPAYEQSHAPTQVVFNFAGSGVLQHQIEQGAPVDVFLSAGLHQIESLERQGLLRAGTRRNLLQNQLVLIVPKHSATPSRLANGDRTDSAPIQHLAQLGQVNHLAIGDPDSVPAGHYARQALLSLGLYEPLRSRLLLAKDVRQVLTYVETDNVDAGLVYATDARRSDRVRVAATLNPSYHDPIIYPVAIPTTSAHPQLAETWIRFLESEVARSQFQAAGFQVLEQPTLAIPSTPAIAPTP